MLADVTTLPARRSHRWPKLGAEAYHGLAGHIVKEIEPHSEADPVAILVTLLSAFGNAIGRNAYATVGAGRHHARIFAALVGETSKARKGMSWGFPEYLMHAADRYWTEERVKTGLSSGEGLIYQVRDKKMGVDKKGREIVEDQGCEDKRLFVVEEEFGTVLKMATRDGNILSAIIRTAWDGKKLASMTKNSPQEATNAHISVLGHVTKTELIKLLNESDAHNGFANRFLWVCVKRSKALPFGGEWEDLNVDDMVSELGSALRFAKGGGHVRWGNTAKPLWEERYESLSEGAPGLFGAVTSRAEAQVLRLAMVYALMDGSWFLEEPHLRAALALWDYCEASARFIFGDSTGDSVADRIEEALSETPYGLTRTEIAKVLGRNQPAKRIQEALTLLHRFGRARVETVEGRSRPVERWYAKGVRVEVRSTK